MKIYFTLLYLFLLINISFSQTVSYELKMDDPKSHYFQVDMILKGFKNKEIEVKMPVWTPGSYLVRDFPKNINHVFAIDEDGKKLMVHKVSKNTWQIQRQKSRNIRVSYLVYAFDLTVRTSFLDENHGYVNGTSMFMYTEETLNKPGELMIQPHESFSKISTNLSLKSGEGFVNDLNSQVFTFSNYDELVDSPIEIGNQHEFTFQASGVEHTVAMFGWGNYDEVQLKQDMAKIIEAETAVFDLNPNKHYTFIIHNVTNSQGGLEHSGSTTLSVNRFSYQGEAYLGFLSLVAHEYFHLWNVKRIRAKQLGPFDYDQEVYTSLLWVMEGFTSYYDELILLRAGFYTKKQYLAKLQSTINYIERRKGTRVQSVADASFDAWIKAYQPNANSSNTTTSYYSKGSIIAALFDVMIIEKYQGEKCLDDFMKILYQKYYVKLSRGFTPSEFQDEISEFLDRNMNSFFEKYIYGTAIPDYDSFFSKVGIQVENQSSDELTFGANLSQSGRSVIISSLITGSSAEKSGLSVGDEILSVNGIRASESAIDKAISFMGKDETLNLLIARDNVIMEKEFKLFPSKRYAFKMSAIENDKEAIELLNYWLRSTN